MAKESIWPASAERFCGLLGIKYPVIQAPMAGGPSTPALAAAVSEAGGLGSLGAGYLSPADLESQIAEVRSLTGKPFGVNLFVPPGEVSEDVSPAVLARLKEFAWELGADEPVPGATAVDFEEQLRVVIDSKVPVFSFTFGVPEGRIMDKLLEAGLKVMGTATCVREARELERAGCSAVVAQGMEAGGHRGTFESTGEVPLIGSMTLIPQIADAVSVPVIASGGVMDGRGIAASLVLGASAVQMGTAFMSCEEAGVSATWLGALLKSDDRSTVITKTFTGKYARGIRNRFIEEMKPLEKEIPLYPVQNGLTRGIRNAANLKGEPDFMSLWAGQGSAMCRRMKARELVEKLVSEAVAILAK